MVNNYIYFTLISISDPVASVTLSPVTVPSSLLSDLDSQRRIDRARGRIDVGSVSLTDFDRFVRGNALRAVKEAGYSHSFAAVVREVVAVRESAAEEGR